MRQRATVFLCSAFLLLSAKVFAHYPTLDCTLEEQLISCFAGYSDGSIAVEEPVDVLTYDEEPITSLTTDDTGHIEFHMPKGQFYLIFDPGHEEPAEFDYAEF